ncbi:MAG: septal ring lytic transglycosylase RlpA family protein [Trichlorobacter sp.]|uniref:septal ring lytic transglycosylase RlpA family protein n=1 Tax=Trichlorobacter sp. TaxID=2911007 RepID=UPI00255D8823|nr:septal ring lytic transglycosylase RlpA family protein [Trichlorobacter sp.]MDK9717863.1 septal ring lytic transglycosylase RlpA family protein [Trichlorobacter sp.]
MSRYRLQITGPANIIMLLVITLLFAGCARQRYTVPDTAPHKISKPYVVQGKRYEPLATADGFVQEGLASFYGRDFHGRKTSNGELFDMHGLTAAHKTLPFGVYVKVEHRRTGKEVLVRINDRGPFVGNRIIDLSEGAASRIGLLQEGVAAVKISALGYKSGDSYRQLSSYDTGSYTIQVGAFTVKENAYRYRDELKKNYGAADVQDSWIKNTRYYRVRLGRFESLQQAQTNRDEYEQKGFKGCFVVAVD